MNFGKQRIPPIYSLFRLIGPNVVGPIGKHYCVRAIENQTCMLGVNRVGEGDNSYVGDSALIDPWGETLVSGASSEALLMADVDAEVVAETRTTFPVLQDRRS